MSADDLFQPDDEGGYGLVMPFLPVTSKGGPFDDQAYVAGYEMGRIDAILAAAQALGLTPDTHYYVTPDNAEQIDLIAMRYGFACTLDAHQVEGWVSATITAIVPDEPDEDEATR